MKPVIALPPLPFAVNATIAELLPRVTLVERRGDRYGRGDERAGRRRTPRCSPRALVATTVQVYVLRVGERAHRDRRGRARRRLRRAAVARGARGREPEWRCRRRRCSAVNATTAGVAAEGTPVTLGADGGSRGDEGARRRRRRAVTGPVRGDHGAGVRLAVRERADRDRRRRCRWPTGSSPPSLDVHVAVKRVMALPPLPFAVNATVAELLPRVTPVSVGASAEPCRRRTSSTPTTPRCRRSRS